nr:TetR-like C-terminal domain-containing protein [Micromonospora sp. DSM 115978]
DPGAVLDAMGSAYLRYAHAHPEQYALIYSREVAVLDDPDVGAAAAAAYDLYVGSVAQAVGAGLLPPGDPRPFAAVMLATAHGVAGLAGAGHFDSAKWGLDEQDVARLLLSMVVGGSVSPAAD